MSPGSRVAIVGWFRKISQSYWLRGSPIVSEMASAVPEASASLGVQGALATSSSSCPCARVASEWSPVVPVWDGQRHMEQKRHADQWGASHPWPLSRPWDSPTAAELHISLRVALRTQPEAHARLPGEGRCGHRCTRAAEQRNSNAVLFAKWLFETRPQVGAGTTDATTVVNHPMRAVPEGRRNKQRV